MSLNFQYRNCLYLQKVQHKGATYSLGWEQEKREKFYWCFSFLSFVIFYFIFVLGIASWKLFSFKNDGEAMLEKMQMS